MPGPPLFFRFSHIYIGFSASYVQTFDIFYINFLCIAFTNLIRFGFDNIYVVKINNIKLNN